MIWTKPIIKHNELTKWNWVVAYPNNFLMGENTDIGAFTYINAKYVVRIGNNVKIGSHCSIYSQNTIDRTHGNVKIEDDVCIGSHAVILPNAIIRKGAKIGAFSLVKGEIPAGAVYVGVPAKPLLKFKTAIGEIPGERY